MSKRRPHGMRAVLCIMLLNMVFYYSTYQEIFILYQFCALKYDVTYTEYSVMNTFGNFVNFCSLAFLGRNSIALKMARKWPRNGILKKDICPN